MKIMTKDIDQLFNIIQNINNFKFPENINFLPWGLYKEIC